MEQERALAPACVAQLVGCCSTKLKVAGWIPAWGTCLNGRPSWGTCKRPPIDVSFAHLCFSPSLSPSLPLSLKIKSWKEEREGGRAPEQAH